MQQFMICPFKRSTKMLRQIIGTMSNKQFFEKHWGKRHVVLDGNLGQEISFNRDYFFKIIDRNNLEFPRLTCMNNQGQCPIDQYANITPSHINSKVIAKKVKNLADNGNTIRIRGIDQFSDEIE